MNIAIMYKTWVAFSCPWSSHQFLLWIHEIFQCLSRKRVQDVASLSVDREALHLNVQFDTEIRGTVQVENAQHLSTQYHSIQ